MDIKNINSNFVGKHVYYPKKLTSKKGGNTCTRKNGINLLVELSPPGIQIEFVKEIAAPIPKTPRTLFKYNDLHVGLIVSLERKNIGKTAEDSGWEQNQFKAFALGGTATCKDNSNIALILKNKSKQIN